MAASLTAFGFGRVGLSEKDFSEPKRTVQLGYPPNRIDILTSIDGVSFEKAWRGRRRGDFFGIPVAFIGLRDLIQNKVAADRDKDRLDVRRLRRRIRK